MPTGASFSLVQRVHNASRVGFCTGTTIRPREHCETRPNGAFAIRSLSRCINQCITCQNCNYISFSKAQEDCSWYKECNMNKLIHPPPGTNYISLELASIGLSHILPRSDPFLAAKQHREVLVKGGIRGSGGFGKRAGRVVLPRRRKWWPDLPRDFNERVDVSVLMQYWAAPSFRTVDFAQGTAEFLDNLVTALMTEGYTFEVIINSDSRHVRHGDLATFVRSLGPSGYLVLSPNVGEARAYNMLARLARGTVLMFVQDDWQVVTERTEWVQRVMAVLANRHHAGGGVSPAEGAELGIGMVGMDVSVESITCANSGNVLLNENSVWPPSIKGKEVKESAALPPLQLCDAYNTAGGANDANSSLAGLVATPCASMGPLFIHRGLFLDLGGFNETLSVRGKPQSLLDCDLSARVWDAKHAVVVAKMNYVAIRPRTPSAAWLGGHHASRADQERCHILNSQYEALFGGHGDLVTRAKGVSQKLSLCPSATISRRGLAALFGFGGGGGGGSAAAASSSSPPPRKAAPATTTEDLRMRVNFSFAVMYWGGGSDAQGKLNEVVIPMLTRLPWACGVAEVSCEVLVNSDSRHIRDGDAHMMLSALGESDTLLLSPNTHEIRAYNRLALISRGTYIGFLQDDTLPPRPDVEVSWLTQSAHLFWSYKQVGSIGMRMGLFFVSQYNEELYGVQTLDDLPDKMPVCRDKAKPYPAKDGELTEDPSLLYYMTDEVKVEAMRCADVGPLIARREGFLAVGGYNETATTLGEPASVRVDCDLQARMWLNGHAALYLGLDHNMGWGHTEERRAWKHPKMIEGHKVRMQQYYEQYERPGSEERRTIERDARRMNRKFDCPRGKLSTTPRTKFDCFVVNAPGTCLK